MLSKTSSFSSERLSYRGIERGDAGLIVAWRSDPENAACFFGDAPTLESHLRWFEGYLLDASRHDFMIFDPEGNPIGTVSLSDDGDGSCEVGYMIGERSARGHGYAAEAVRAACRVASEHIGARRVVARIKPGNVASERVAAAAGLRDRGRVWCVELGPRGRGEIDGVVGPYVLMRLDGGEGIGSGHVVRCSSIAAELGRIGVRTVVAASTAESAGLASERGMVATVVGGDPFGLGGADASALAPLMGGGCVAVLVDTYGAGDGFWSRLAGIARETGTPLALIDDRYTFSGGATGEPVRRPADLVVAYDFGADGGSYDRAYSGAARLLVGPRYAPVRPGFSRAAASPRGEVRRVLVSTGSTNPGRSLEALASACVEAVPSAAIDVVLGPGATFVPSPEVAARASVHRGLTDLGPLMSRADIAVSAGGTTLYELACMGVPAVAVPVVENQLENVRGFASLGCGISVTGAHDPGLVQAVSGLAGDPGLREGLSERARSIVDGRGAERVARALARLGGGERC